MHRPERPRQAVILAGGRGTRMRPLTNTRPKPMVMFHGRPFLEYVVEMLREQGFERVLMLLGYLPEVVRDHFGDGAGFGVEIDYSVTGADDLTVSRMQVARDRIEESFLLLYCDNYWPMRMDDMWRRFRGARRHRDGDRVRKSRRIPSGEGHRSRRGRVCQGVRQEPNPSAGSRGSRSATQSSPIRCSICYRSEDELFELALYPELARRGELGAYVSEHRYYSVGSLERLAATERFLARRPAVILDRDGTLNRRPAACAVRDAAG